eukprot:143456-Prymnesium_polylepis.1
MPTTARRERRVVLKDELCSGRVPGTADAVSRGVFLGGECEHRRPTGADVVTRRRQQERVQHPQPARAHEARRLHAFPLLPTHDRACCRAQVINIYPCLATYMTSRWRTRWRSGSPNGVQSDRTPSERLHVGMLGRVAHDGDVGLEEAALGEVVAAESLEGLGRYERVREEY